jgi:hypothetical protein
VPEAGAGLLLGWTLRARSVYHSAGVRAKLATRAIRHSCPRVTPGAIDRLPGSNIPDENELRRNIEMLKIKEIAATLAILGTGAFAVAACNKEKQTTETPGDTAGEGGDAAAEGGDAAAEAGGDAAAEAGADAAAAEAGAEGEKAEASCGGEQGCGGEKKADG